jgi:hypothetical protein
MGMQISRAGISSESTVQAWIDRRRDEYQRTSTALRVTGAVGWGLVALVALGWVR